MIEDEEEEDVQVHKHLLSGRSELFKADVEKIEDGYWDWAWFNLDMQAAFRYVSFLYGQPMWAYAPGGNINEEWRELHELYNFSTYREDFDAADACIDGMREMLQSWRSDLTRPFEHLRTYRSDFGKPCGSLVVDYMVHRSCDTKQWINHFEECDHMENPGSLQDALSRKFAEEAQRKKDKTTEPDLMERCRYHLHIEKGLPCYLDK